MTIIKNVRFLAFFALILLSNNSLASSDLGGVAHNIIEPMGVVGDFIHTACFVLGGAFIFTSIIKYFEYKKSPLMTPLSTVVFLIIAGIILIDIPLISHFTDTGLPVHTVAQK